MTGWLQMPVIVPCLAFLSGACFVYGLRIMSRSDARKQAEMARLNTLFEDAIAAIEDGFVLYDSDDRMFICNDPFRSQFAGAEQILRKGLTYEDQIRELAHSGVVPDIEGKEDEFIAALMARRQSDFGVVRVFETNDGRWIRQRDKKTAAGNVVGLRTDVTELKRNEIMLEAAREQAEAAARAKAAFLANMSHEIRTPMNGIIGMAELLDETPLNDDQRMFTRTVIESCNALQAIVNDILDFSKVEAGKMEIRSEPFDLAECIHNVAALLAPNAADKGIEICTDIQTDASTWFLGDSGRIRQILINLVGNALKFTHEGFVLIRLQMDPETGTPRILVRDTGIGIPEDKQATIFSAFEQVDNESTRQFDGTGLGLAISHRLIRLMEGSIDVESKLNKGSDFTVQLPLPESDPVAGANFDAPGALPKGLNVLVVDDLEINRVILQRHLESWGATVVVAESGPVALDKLRDHTRFDLAFLDYQMPEMDGLTLRKRMLGMAEIADFPVVLLSSVEKNVAGADLVRDMFDAVLLKPARAEMLQSTMARLLSGGPGARPTQAITSAGQGASLTDVKILVAEDNRTNQLVISRILEGQGAEVQICENGAEAVEAFFANRPDMVLMDVSMPVMNGLEATRAIRGRETTAPVPIIALTANAMAEDRDQCLAAGMSDFLAKPMRKARALEVIGAWMPNDQVDRRASG
ncbi:hypothetical protein ACMU_16710 [Actibacterium mucosum KCTC 23349]|uniref:Sensory/regulatory protein RpfC n=1 Tax=Actibacterium mucosum KCTC 23349 TaxID=1454373 RepID=A0A037ZIU8_9RHOB|nr:response regulator [Actibacterium mucosum]KAJ54755.1 hypothetical protein ACMU_16710 [Actibacterium mucosum KCTC 23349]